MAASLCTVAKGEVITSGPTIQVSACQKRSTAKKSSSRSKSDRARQARANAGRFVKRDCHQVSPRRR